MDSKHQITSAQELGEQIRALRKKVGVSQIELAASSDTGVRFIQDLEKGKPTCELQKTLHVAHMLGIKLEITLPCITGE